MASLDRQPRRWTSAEDQTLRKHVEAQQAEGESRDWCRVASALPRRTNKDCRKRWHNSVAGGLRKGQWSRAEDQLLTNGVHQYGSRWTLVANCVASRSADQCAKRWQQSLDPRLDHSDWREDEDIALMRAVDRLSRHWKDIQQQYLPHRSKNCIKNRYSVLARRTGMQTILYDDSLTSSSSNPGTPLQIATKLQPTDISMPIGHDVHAPYMQYPMLAPSDDELSWAWLGLDHTPAPAATSHHSPYSPPLWPSTLGFAANPSNPSRWTGMAAIELPHPQHTNIPIPSPQNHALSSPPLYAPQPAQSFPTPPHFHSSPPTSREWYPHPYRDTAPFG